MDFLVFRYVAWGDAMRGPCTVIVVVLARTVFGVFEVAKTGGSGAFFLLGFSLFASLSVSFGGAPTALLYRGGGSSHWHVAAAEVVHVFSACAHMSLTVA